MPEGSRDLPLGQYVQNLQQLNSFHVCAAALLVVLNDPLFIEVCGSELLPNFV